ncbi:hypothetical protein EON83_12815 [bacterium]|nr:MAG: hypothetical protein EON83_12815 [bacterium]
MKLLFPIVVVTVLALPTIVCADTTITSNGITWKFVADYQAGRFVNGDPWVIGPVTITSITNTLNDPAFTPRRGQNGSMLNPGITIKQGYESAITRNYDESMNASLPNGQPVSDKNPLILPPNSTLVSTVSWLFNSPTELEPTAPRFDSITGVPRSATRSAGILTVLSQAPSADAFRPPYVGTDKTINFRTSKLDYSKLPALSLPPNASAPDMKSMADSFSRTWLDHGNTWIGAANHPTLHMPNYGRDMAKLVVDATLLLFTDPSPVGKNPDKDRLIIGLVQFGIDSAGIADNGGGWPADGGHGLGRKWPILFAGALLSDAHLLGVGQWETRFQENEQTFYVSQTEVDLSNSATWSPDRRAPVQPYTATDIGKPEWGIAHAKNPKVDNAHWSATYREVNGAAIPGFALAARLMNLKKAWNHDAFFDYCDRYMAWRIDMPPVANQPSKFLVAMWNAYRPTAPKE